ncbi:MAG: hypothetical protein M3409_10125 [Gemmatimonadota bacterium]|nr:hypothetical protein [Gemmatimonadota bacterium]
MSPPRRVPTAAGLLLLFLAACGEGSVAVSGGAGAPRDLRAEYAWILEGFDGLRPVGNPAVELTWSLPAGWDGEAFRVYGRRAGSGSDLLLATVTSCAEGRCRYSDLNVRSGATYEYRVATLEQGGGERPSGRETARVPAYTPPPSPRQGSTTALNGALYLRWSDGGAGDALWKYQVYLVEVDGERTLYQAGETDGTGFVDTRARNGSRYTYRLAAVDTAGHLSDLGDPLQGIPRPDARAKLIYSFGDRPAQSGFRFDAAEPVVAGDAAAAQWRLERTGGVLSLRPLAGTEVSAGILTTSLNCGPGAGPDCRALTVAPGSGYTAAPVALDAEHSYALRVRGSDGRVHFGVVRVSLLGADAQGRELMIFDWAYQLLPDEPRLQRSPG